MCEGFKCLDHNEVVGSRICMSKNVDLSNMLFLAVHFVPTWWMGKKYSKYMILYFSYLKLCRSTTTEWILHSDVIGLYLSGKNSASTPSGMTQVFLSQIWDRLVSFRKDSRPNSSHSNIVRSTPLKLIYNISNN